MGIIYCLTSPSNKIYIGQTIDTLDNRWRDHIYDATDPNKNHCVALNNAIRKYGSHNFDRKTIVTCSNDKLDFYEEECIEIYNSTNPNIGYNIKTGGSFGRHSEESKKKISQSLIGRVVKDSTKLKLSQTTKSDKTLPMYIIEFKYKKQVIGYRVCNHPNGPERKFTDSILTMNEKLNKAKEHLLYLNNLEQPINAKIRNLPQYFQCYKHGYCIKVPGYPTKYFLKKVFTSEELYDLALEYYNKCVPMNAVQRLNGDGSHENEV